MGYARLIVVAVLTTTFVVVGGPARATDMTAEEVAELAEIAAHDDDARERLEDVDSIDGRTIDMRRILRGAAGTEVEERIRALVGSDTAAPVPSSDSARNDARAILADRRFHPPPIPRPFRSIVERIGNLLDPIIGPIGDFFSWIARAFSALAGIAGGGLGLALVIAAVVLTLTVIRARTVIAARSHAGRSAAGLRDPGDDPKRLEIQAAEAEERGDHGLAVRLRFRAGILRLGAAKVIPRRPSLTTGELRRLLASPDFDRLGIAFDEIAYGGRRAAPDDAANARTVWDRVLTEKVAR